MNEIHDSDSGEFHCSLSILHTDEEKCRNSFRRDEIERRFIFFRRRQSSKGSFFLAESFRLCHSTRSMAEFNLESTSAVFFIYTALYVIFGQT